MKINQEVDLHRHLPQRFQTVDQRQQIDQTLGNHQWIGEMTTIGMFFFIIILKSL